MGGQTYQQETTQATEKRKGTIELGNMQVIGGIFKGSLGGLLYGRHMILGMSDKRRPKKCSLWEKFFGEI